MSRALLLALRILFLLSYLAAAIVCAQERTTHAHRIQLEITTYLGDRQTFAEGDNLSFLVTLYKDAYLLVLYETSQHQLIQLLPHRYSTARKYKAGIYIPVPDESARYHFVIAPPFGKERVLAFAADRTLPNLPGKDLNNGLRLLTGNTEGVLQQLRNNITDQDGSFGEASLELTTRAR
jgi:hypothetical protein